MSTTKKTAHPAAKHTPAASAAAIPAAITAPAAPAAAPEAIAAPKVPNVVLINLPPASANIPAPPTGFTPTSGSNYRGITPKKSELAVLPQAVVELGRFTDYALIFGKTAPPLIAILQTFTAALQWSLMRNATDAWDLYCRTMEGLAWKDARALMDKIGPSFHSAVATDATIATDYPSLASLLDAQKEIARRGVVTRKANEKSKAKGEPPTHGKAAKKAAKLAAQAAAVAAPVAPAASPAPVVAMAAPAAPTAAPVAGSSNGSSNGAAH